MGAFVTASLIINAGVWSVLSIASPRHAWCFDLWSHPTLYIAHMWWERSSLHHWSSMQECDLHPLSHHRGMHGALISDLIPHCMTRAHMVLSCAHTHTHKHKLTHTHTHLRVYTQHTFVRHAHIQLHVYLTHNIHKYLYLFQYGNIHRAHDSHLFQYENIHRAHDSTRAGWGRRLWGPTQ